MGDYSFFPTLATRVRYIFLMRIARLLDGHQNVDNNKDNFLK